MNIFSNRIMWLLAAGFIWAQISYGAESAMRVVPVREVMVAAYTGFDELNLQLAVSGFDAPELRSSFVEGLASLKHGIAAFDGSDSNLVTNIVRDKIGFALSIFDSISYQIQYDSMHIIVVYANALANLRRAAIAVDNPEDTRFIAQGIFPGSYLFGPQQTKLYAFASGECRSRGLKLAQALDLIGCRMPGSNTVACAGVFRCMPN